MTDMKAIGHAAIDTYREELNTGIDTITEGLNALCAHITNVDYEGKNAFQFRVEASEIANKLSTKIYAEIEALGKHVEAATSALSDALGGSPITIHLTEDNVVTPAQPGNNTDDGVADVSALRSLIGQVATAFETVTSGVNMVQNMPPNERTGWMGDERNATEGHVGEFCEMARANCGQTEETLDTFINSQISALEGK